MPRWLLDDDEDEDDIVQPNTPSSGSNVRSSHEETLPAWLRDPQPTQNDDDTAPSWAQPESQAAQPATQQDAQRGASVPPDAARTEASTPPLPDWLLDPDPTPATDPPAAPNQGDNWLGAASAAPNQPEMPRWLVDPEGPADTTSGAAPASTSGVPDWLLDTTPNATQPPSSTEQPDWLQMLGQTDADTPAVPQTQDSSSRYGVPAAPNVTQQSQSMNAQAAPLPDWLMPTAEETAQADQAAQAAPAEPEDDVPDWLRDFTSSQPPTIDQQPEPRAIDQWLTDTGPEPPSFAAIPIPSTPESRARIYDVRDEEEDIDTSAPREQSPPLPSWLAGQTNQTGDAPWALPPWLSEADAPPEQPVAATAPVAENPARTSNLPSWLQQDDPDMPTGMPSHTNAAPSWLHADDPTQASNQTTHRYRDKAADEIPVDPATDQATSSEILERIVTEPESEPVAVLDPPAARRSSIWRTIIPFIVFALIVAAILYVLWSGVDIRTFFGGSNGPVVASTMPVFQRNRDLTVGVVRWQEHLAQLPSDAPVLVAYATDGAHGTELAALEAELVAQLQARSHPLVSARDRPARSDSGTPAYHLIDGRCTSPRPWLQTGWSRRASAPRKQF